jgi:hypothetical protein
MTDGGLDPEVAAAVRAALGGDVPGRLADAAAVVNDAAAACRMDAGAVILTAVALVRACRARGGTPGAARVALADAWPVTSQRDLADVLAALIAFAGVWASEAQLAEAAAIGAGLP